MSWRAIVAEIGPREALGLAGMALLAVGLWMAWPPLAPIVLGLLLLAAGVLPGTKA
jgi:hypothetical protein